jgi:NAD(P)-dependent dehydrogenase (short-subunit alcohol dehydrogenase family)
MGGRLDGKVALITGAGGGIGSQTARRFAAEGAWVVVNDISESNADAVVREIRELGGKALANNADVTSAAQIQAMLSQCRETFGGLDILVNNAFGKFDDTTITELDEDSWDRTIEACLKGPFLCTKYAIPLMQRRGAGSIISVSSVNALRTVGDTAYTAAKGGLIAMMRLVAGEYGGSNIRSNVICPGTIATHASMSHWEKFPAGFEQLKTMYPLGRIGEPDDIANCALFLASDESRWITGTVHVVDGGLMAGNKLELK